jgi:thiamine-phosphate pyrophosphorylase
MTRDVLAPKIVLITDPRYSLAHVVRTIEEAASVLEPFDLLVQLRDKSATSREASVLREATRNAGALFVVNGDIDLALATDADGLHIGGVRPDIQGARARFEEARDPRRRLWISVAAHADEDVLYGVRSGATAVLVSPIFETPGKGRPRGTGAIESARRIIEGEGRVGEHAKLLVYALGGIDARRAAACSAADGVAVIRALLDDTDVRVTARGLAAPFDGERSGARRR